MLNGQYKGAESPTMMNSMPMTPTRKFRFPMGSPGQAGNGISVDQSIRSLSHSKHTREAVEETASLFSYHPKAETQSKVSRSIIYRRSNKSNKRLSIVDGSR